MNKRQIKLIVAMFVLTVLFQNCGQGFQSQGDSISEHSSNTQCKANFKVQDLVGRGQLTLKEAIHSQHMDASHEAHQVHMGDDDKISDHTALLSMFPQASDPKVFVALKGGSWFNPQTWSKNKVPSDGDQVLIPHGISVVYDQVSDKRLDLVGVDGELHFEVERDTRMLVDTFLASPRSILTIGTNSNPVRATKKAEIIIHRDKGPLTLDQDPKLLKKGLIAHGTTRIVGHNKTDHTKISASHPPQSGENFIVLDEMPLGWRAGDTLIVAGVRHDASDFDQLSHKYQDEIVTIKSIDKIGQQKIQVNLNESFQFDHVPPQHKANVTLRVPVANFSRNIFIGTETSKNPYKSKGASVPIMERGHVMFMHGNDVHVKNAAFVELGRTDKSKHFSTTNVAGRYALHFHRTGIRDLSAPAIAEGNAIWGSPGWGIVHHDANLDVISNAVFRVFGSGIVAEAGNETGRWSENIVIQTYGIMRTFNAEQSSDSNGNQPVDHPAYQAEIENNSFAQGEAYGMKSRLLPITNNIAVGANGAGFSFWPHGKTGPSHIGAHSKGFRYLFNYDPFFGSDSIYPGKVPTRIFHGNEVIGSRHALNTSANKIAHRHDMDVIIEDLLAWNTDQPIMSFYQENYLIKDSIFIYGDANHERNHKMHHTSVGDQGPRATHIHDPLDFKMVNNYFEGFDVITEEPMQLILGNKVVGSSVAEETGPNGRFKEGATADAEPILKLDNSIDWKSNMKNPVGTLQARVLLNSSTLNMVQTFSRFCIELEKTDTLGTRTMGTGSCKSKEFRGASQKGWWSDNAKSYGYYTQPNGDIYLLTHAVVGDRVTGTTGSIEVAIRIDFAKGKAMEIFPKGSVNNGPLPDRLDSNGVGKFKIVDKREIGKISFEQPNYKEESNQDGLPQGTDSDGTIPDTPSPNTPNANGGEGTSC